MVRISADLLLTQSEQTINTLNERELNLRGLLIPQIENLATLQQQHDNYDNTTTTSNTIQFDTIDFTDNRITTIDNFPKSCKIRLSHLIFCNNLINSINVINIKNNVPNLSTLNLSYNVIDQLNFIRCLGISCKNLKYLFLVGNPVTRIHYYRLYTIHTIPSLQVLDYIKINQKDRDKAKRFALSAAGAALQSDILQQQNDRNDDDNTNTSDNTNTFIPGKANTTKENFRIQFTIKEKEQIRHMIMNASNPSDVETIEEYVRRGEFPSMFLSKNDGDDESKKRELEDTTDEAKMKKNRT